MAMAKNAVGGETLPDAPGPPQRHGIPSFITTWNQLADTCPGENTIAIMPQGKLRFGNPEYLTLYESIKLLPFETGMRRDNHRIRIEAAEQYNCEVTKFTEAVAKHEQGEVHMVAGLQKPATRAVTVEGACLEVTHGDIGATIIATIEKKIEEKGLAMKVRGFMLGTMIRYQSSDPSTTIGARDPNIDVTWRTSVIITSIRTGRCTVETVQ